MNSAGSLTLAGVPQESSDPVLARVDVKAMPRILGRLTRLALRYPGRSAAAVGCALGAAVFNLMTPRLLGQAVDEAHRLLLGGALHADAARTALLGTALLIVAACTLRGTLTGLQGYLGESIAQRVGCVLRLAYFEKLQRLSFGFHDTNHSGDLIARGMLDLEGVRGFLESGLLRVVTLVLLLGVGSWQVLHTDPALGLLSLSFVPFVVWRATRMGVRLRVTWNRLQELLSNLTLDMEENLQGSRVIRAFAAVGLELAKFDRIAQAALELSNRRIAIRMSAMSAMNLAYYSAMGLVLLVGGQRVAEGSLTVGVLTELLTFMGILQLPVRQVGMIVNSSARATSSGTRLFEVLDAEPDIADAPGARDLEIDQGVLRFEHVDFAYPRGGREVLSDICLEVRAGQRLGIVGPPGSGKSTLASLITRCYDVTAGRITIDGQDLREVRLGSLRRSVSLVQQEIFLFDASIRENVAYADPLAEDERVTDATAIAQLHDHVASLPQGYGTRVGERGVALSGGQRQRMSIARALVAEPRIIVLDDSTAAIDAQTEGRVRAALQGAVDHMATIVIAHRLSSLKDAHEILFLDDGRIVERGSHAGLLAQRGRYAALWALQDRAGRAPDHADRQSAGALER
jgi:ATP-binding cassette, subfamily B, multidrug efflux pump